MEEGSLRVDANVSVRPVGAEELGTKTELKNMNSFRFLQRGIEAELERQREVIGAGGRVLQETLHFDPRSGDLTPLRSKEEAHDYRYFPEPDLVPLAPTEEMLREAREALPELPAARIARYEAELGLAGNVAATLATAPATAEFLKVEPDALATLLEMVQANKLSHGSGKAVLATLVLEGGDPEAVVEQEGLAQISADDGELEGIVAAAIEANPEAAEQIRAGNEKAIGAIVGAVMKETRGRADGAEVNRLIKQQLAG